MTGTTPRPLAGRRIVVTRARPGPLDDLLGDLGAEVVRAPAITFVEPDDGGVALREAIFRVGLGAYDWVVLTSATTIERLRSTAGGTGGLRGASVAVVGPATARAVEADGIEAALVATRALGESLVEDFPSGPGRALVLRPEVARDVVPEGLRDKGWQVDEVAAYRTVSAALSAATLARVEGADVVTFTSPSTVEGLLAAVDPGALPDLVVTIGPVTSGAVREHGLSVAAEADPHTVDGLVEAVLATVNRG